MKKITRTLITIIMLFTAASLLAQMSSNQQLMKVDVPFAFSSLTAPSFHAPMSVVASPRRRAWRPPGHPGANSFASRPC